MTRRAMHIVGDGSSRTSKRFWMRANSLVRRLTLLAFPSLPACASSARRVEATSTLCPLLSFLGNTAGFEKLINHLDLLVQGGLFSAWQYKRSTLASRVSSIGNGPTLKDLPSSVEATSTFNSKGIVDSDYIDIATSLVKSSFEAEANVFDDLSWSMA